MGNGGRWADFLEKFQPDPNVGVYVLGSYAKYATMYSQQIRALNLVAALWDTGHLEAGTQVAVIGGGAAGLTASAAAALLGADVTVVERLEGLMELQRNNRQRWVHPHIYDWPVPDDPSDRARLPILDWEAGYAERVAEQLEEEWKRISQRAKLKAYVGRQEVGVQSVDGVPYVSWSGSAYPRPFEIVIFAVGFGLEPSTGYRWSYWEEDAIDAGVLRGITGRTWLVSGYGDSALTDLMRLCIRRFRHADLPMLFSRRRETLEMLKRDLLDIHRDERAHDPAFLTERFGRLETGGLEEELRPRLRTGIRVHHTGDGPFPYQPRASLLNRLMLCLLAKLEAFEYIPGRVAGEVERAEEGFMVPLPAGPRFFNHVILRHAPVPALASSFRDIDAACQKSLLNFWNVARARDDTTRRRQWLPQNLFGGSAIPLALAEQDAFKQLGVGIGTLTVRKQLWSDGRAMITYRIDDLTVLHGRIDGVRLWLQSHVGKVGRPQFDAQGEQLGLSWAPDPEHPLPDNAPFREHLQTARERVRRLSGMIRFPEAVTPETSPVSFGLSVPELNADGLSLWQFEQFYAEVDRTHMDRQPVQEREYFARISWPPVGTLVVQLSLPSDYDVRPEVSVFACPEPAPPVDAILKGQEVLLSPAPGSPLSPGTIAWPRVENTALQPELTWVGGTPAWQVTVPRPSIGRAYSLDWRVKRPAADSDFDALAEKAGYFRKRLLDHRRDRLNGSDGGAVREAVLAFAREVRRQYGDPRPDERFDVTLLTYNQIDRVVEVVEGTVNGGDPAQDCWEFRLPFGLGVAGSAFKSARAQLYVPAAQRREADPDNFLDLPLSRDLKGLVALPVDHPAFEGPVTLADRSRQVVAVIDISSDLPASRLVTSLKELASHSDPTQRLGPLPDLARDLRDKLYRLLC